MRIIVTPPVPEEPHQEKRGEYPKDVGLPGVRFHGRTVHAIETHLLARASIDMPTWSPRNANGGLSRYLHKRSQLQLKSPHEFLRL